MEENKKKMLNKISFKELMEAHRFSQRELSRLSGVNLTTIASLTRGERDFKSIHVSNAQKIAEVFGMSIEKIILTLKETDRKEKL